MKHEGLYYAKHCAIHGDYDDLAQVCPKCVPAPPSRAAPPPVSVEKSIEEAAEAEIYRLADGIYSCGSMDAIVSALDQAFNLGQRRERDRWRHDIDVGDVIKAQEENTRLQAQVKAATEALERSQISLVEGTEGGGVFWREKAINQIGDSVALLREGGKQKGEANGIS